MHFKSFEWSAHLCHQRTPECPYPLVLAHTPHTRDDTQTSQWCSPPDNWTNYRDWLLNNRVHFYEAPCLIILIPSMYLLRMTLHWTGVFTKSWLMVARAGSITIGIRNRNKENVQIPKKHQVIQISSIFSRGDIPTDAAAKVT